MGLIVLPFGLIGDFIGAFPLIKEAAMKCLARKEPFFVATHREAEDIMRRLFPMKKYGVQFIGDAGEGHIHGKTLVVSLTEAFHFAQKHPCYMTQAYYRTLGWPVPFLPERPEFQLDDVRSPHLEVDFGLAPFARSLPGEQRWPRDKWQRLVNMMPDRSFVLYGSTQRGDDPKFVSGPNVTTFFDHDLEELALSIRDLRAGLISVSTGPSHIAYAVGTLNYLIINQGPFCKNPAAVLIDSAIPHLSPETVFDIIEAREKVLANV